MWITIYCDASFKNGRSTGGYWIKSGDKRIVESIDLDAKDSQMAELEIAEKAIYKAVQEHSSIKITGIHLVSDNMTVVKVYRYKAEMSNHKEIRKFQQRIVEYFDAHEMRIKTVHQKGHQSGQTAGSYLNNAVDKKAREQMNKQYEKPSHGNPESTLR